MLCVLYILLPPSSSIVLSGRFRSSHSNPTLPNFPPLPTARNKNSPRHSCLSPIDAKVWCGVGSDGDDSTTKYLDQDGNPYVVACCREDFCRSAQHLTNHTLFSVEGLFRTLLSLLPNPEPITLPTSFFIFRISISFWSISLKLLDFNYHIRLIVSNRSGEWRQQLSWFWYLGTGTHHWNSHSRRHRVCDDPL